MKVKHLIDRLQDIDPEFEVVSGTMRDTWNRYHPPMLDVYKKGVRDDLRAVIRKEMFTPDIEGFVLL